MKTNLLILYLNILCLQWAILTYAQERPTNPDYRIEVKQGNKDWQSLTNYMVKVDQVVDAKHHTEDASMAYFTLSESTAEALVTCRREKIEQIRIRPCTEKVQAKIMNDSTVSITFTSPQNISLEINNDIYHNLHLIANPDYEVPDMKFYKRKGESWRTSRDGGTIVFDAGYHTLHQGIMSLKSGQTVFVADGAWIEGGFVINGQENVHVYGPGIVRPKERGYGVEIANSKNILIEGISTTQIPTGGSQYVKLKNIKCFTHYGWGDGLNIFASSHVEQEGCFVRTSDDCVTVYATRMGYIGGSKDIKIRNMTLWADVAHPIFIGLHGAAAYIADTESRSLPLSQNADEIILQSDTIKDIEITDIDILEQNEKQIDYQGAMAIVCGDNNVVRDITFDNIRIDHIAHGSILALRVFQNEKYCKAPGKSIRNIRFKNIVAPAGGELSIIEGYNEERTIQGIHFENFVIDGVRITDNMSGKPRWYKTTDMCRMLLGSYVSNVTFE